MTEEEYQSRIVELADDALKQGRAPDFIAVGKQIDWQPDHYRDREHMGVWTITSCLVSRVREDLGSLSVVSLGLERKSQRSTTSITTNFNAATMRPYPPINIPEKQKPEPVPDSAPLPKGDLSIIEIRKPDKIIKFN